MGGALLAGIGTGLFPSIQQAARDLVQYDRTFTPAVQHKALYADRYQKFRELYDTLRPFNASYGR
jgi:xylulokinase